MDWSWLEGTFCGSSLSVWSHFPFSCNPSEKSLSPFSCWFPSGTGRLPQSLHQTQQSPFSQPFRLMRTLSWAPACVCSITELPAVLSAGLLGHRQSLHAATSLDLECKMIVIQCYPTPKPGSFPLQGVHCLLLRLFSGTRHISAVRISGWFLTSFFNIRALLTLPEGTKLAHTEVCSSTDPKINCSIQENN